MRRLFKNARTGQATTPDKPKGFYGGDRTIHQTGHVDVELHKGKVVAVWFRCSMLPFQQVEVDRERAREMEATELRELEGVVYHLT